MFQRFTERARQVVVFAQDEARLLRHNYIGTEHFLLGLLRERNGLASRILVSLDVTLEDARDEVVQIIGIGDEAAGGEIPFTPRAKKVLELAVQESLALRQDYIGTEHLLLGLAREGSGVAARILVDIAESEDVCDVIVARLGAAPHPPTRRRTRRWRVRR